MNLKKLFSLKEYNTFNIDVKSVYSFFCEVESELSEFSKTDVFKNNRILILGCGSNILFLNDFDGIVIHMQNKGVEIIKETGDFVYLKVAAGEIWDDFVNYCVKNDFGGAENLSLIPGTVGAGPVQNIGAYGVELKDVFFELEALNRNTSEIPKFNRKECKFGYRSSIFKNEHKDQFIILNVTLKLTKKHKLKFEYGTVKDELKYVNEPTIADIRNAVIKIRESKLPDTDKFPNVGSFFKNPVIPVEKFKTLKSKFPEIISFPAGKNYVKLAAGQLIDLCNWKGKRRNGVGVYDKQALVIVNYASASGLDIFNFSEEIKRSVLKKFDVEINREVTIVR